MKRQKDSAPSVDSIVRASKRLKKSASHELTRTSSLVHAKTEQKDSQWTDEYTDMIWQSLPILDEQKIYLQGSLLLEQGLLEEEDRQRLKKALETIADHLEHEAKEALKRDREEKLKRSLSSSLSSLYPE